MQLKLGKYWQIFWKFRKIHLMKLMEYRQDFVFWSAVSLVWTLFNLFFFTLIINVNQGIGGWNIPQMYLLLGVFNILDAFTWSFFYHNMMEYTQAVFSGELNALLTKPIDTQFLLMVRKNSYTGIFRLLIGIAIIIWSLGQLQIELTWLKLLVFLLLLSTTFMFLYFFWFIISTMSFWVEKLNNINEIIPGLRHLYQVPRSVFTGLFSFVFTVVLPIGLITTLPSEYLLGKASLRWISYLILFTLSLIVTARLFFNYSLRQYSSVGN